MPFLYSFSDLNIHICVSATTTTQTQLVNHARSMVHKISPDDDVSVVAAKNRRNLPLDSPKPVLYHNHYVGDCQDLLFGVNLVDYATARGLPDGEIPRIVRLCIQEIDERGLTFEGIYRV
jgi:Rho GTPase-activating protein 12/27